MANSLDVKVHNGKVAEFKHFEGAGMGLALWHIERHEDGTFSGGCETDKAPRGRRNTTLDEVIGCMNNHPQINGRWRALMELEDATEETIRGIRGFRRIKLKVNEAVAA